MKTLIMLLFLTTSAYAMDSIGTFRHSYTPEYRGQKDRYSEATLRNDPEVLVALVSVRRDKAPDLKRPAEAALPPATVKPEPTPVPDQSFYQWCDDNKCGEKHLIEE